MSVCLCHNLEVIRGIPNIALVDIFCFIVQLPNQEINVGLHLGGGGGGGSYLGDSQEVTELYKKMGEKISTSQIHTT